MRNAIFIIIIVMASGCKGCLNETYAVHEKVEYLDITFSDSSVHASALLNYLDSVVARDTTNYAVEIKIHGVNLQAEDRIIHFKHAPDEYYHISCNTTPCWIKGVFNSSINKSDWIYEQKKISVNEIKRIKQRFQKEILERVK